MGHGRCPKCQSRPEDRGTPGAAVGGRVLGSAQRHRRVLSLSHLYHLEQVVTVSRDKESPCPDFQWGGVTGRRSRSFHGSCQGCVYSASARSRQREKVCSPCFLPCVFVIFSDLLLSGEKGTILSICRLFAKRCPVPSDASCLHHTSW